MKKRSSSEKKNQKLTAQANGTPQGITIGMDLETRAVGSAC
jgi:hypothetical protein